VITLPGSPSLLNEHEEKMGCSPLRKPSSKETIDEQVARSPDDRASTNEADRCRTR
jgi:hypothetical protein